MLRHKQVRGTRRATPQPSTSKPLKLASSLTLPSPKVRGSLVLTLPESYLPTLIEG
jgi:hypothetical protein